MHLTPWDSRAQYKHWNAEAYPPRDRTCHQIEAFRAAKRKAQSIMQSWHISLQQTARACWMHPARHGALSGHPTSYRAYYSMEDALVYWDIELTKEWEGRTLKHTERPIPDQSISVPSLRDSSAEMEEEDLEAIPIDRPRNPPTYEEALESLEHAPTEADLCPHSPASCSSSLVPYEIGKDNNTEEDCEDQVKGAEAMDTDGQSTTEPKEGMGIRTAPLAYQPASPRYLVTAMRKMQAKTPQVMKM